jgi:hypothetical protein
LLDQIALRFLKRPKFLALITAKRVIPRHVFFLHFAAGDFSAPLAAWAQIKVPAHATPRFHARRPTTAKQFGMSASAWRMIRSFSARVGRSTT